MRDGAFLAKILPLIELVGETLRQCRNPLKIERNLPLIQFNSEA